MNTGTGYERLIRDIFGDLEKRVVGEKRFLRMLPKLLPGRKELVARLVDIYGLGGAEALPVKLVAEKHGVSKAAVYSGRAKALRMLRHPDRTTRFTDWEAMFKMRSTELENEVGDHGDAIRMFAVRVTDLEISVDRLYRAFRRYLDVRVEEMDQSGGGNPTVKVLTQPK